jgi:hypothetical protein
LAAIRFAFNCAGWNFGKFTLSKMSFEFYVGAGADAAIEVNSGTAGLQLLGKVILNEGYLPSYFHTLLVLCLGIEPAASMAQKT